MHSSLTLQFRRFVNHGEPEWAYLQYFLPITKTKCRVWNSRSHSMAYIQVTDFSSNVVESLVMVAGHFDAQGLARSTSGSCSTTTTSLCQHAGPCSSTGLSRSTPGWTGSASLLIPSCGYPNKLQLTEQNAQLTAARHLIMDGMPGSSQYSRLTVTETSTQREALLFSRTMWQVLR